MLELVFFYTSRTTYQSGVPQWIEYSEYCGRIPRNIVPADLVLNGKPEFRSGDERHDTPRAAGGVLKTLVNRSSGGCRVES
jgi:hypothetical protein